MNFNSKTCTTKEQSERLLALGLKKETADMKLIPYSRFAVPVDYYTNIYGDDPDENDFCRGNIHGHIHRKGVIDGWEYNPQSLGERYFNVNTEFHNYTPVLFDEIEQYFINLNV